MNEDKTVRSSQPASGVKAVLFGIDRTNPAFAVLDIDIGLAVQEDSRQITAPVLAQANWTLAICTLFSTLAEPHHDAVSVIEALVEAGYGGELVVLAPPLLRPKMVETELRALAKGIKLRLIAGALPLTQI